jgi:endonuclease G
MAKFRSNHSRNSAKESGGMIAKVGIFSVIIGLLYVAFQKFSGKQPEAGEPVKEDVQNVEAAPVESIYFLPTSTTGEIVQHKYYALSYLEKYEIAEWVAWELTAERLNQQWVERSNNFRPDPKVSSGSATPDDYRNTRYDRGHLAPAADMAFSEEAMSETFFLSNIAPQDPAFNKGVWRELEELTRDWAKRFKHLYVVTGPVFNAPVKFWIGENQVAVAPAFYRVLLDLAEPEKKAIAFIVPNALSTDRIEAYATSIDEVEKLTGIDFFPQLMEKSLEAELEGSYDMSLWKTNEKKYQIRLEKWNNQQ